MRLGVGIEVLSLREAPFPQSCYPLNEKAMRRRESDRLPCDAEEQRAISRTDSRYSFLFRVIVVMVLGGQLAVLAYLTRSGGAETGAIVEERTCARAAHKIPPNVTGSGEQHHGVLVFAMHRSGSSMFTGLLTQLGLDVGPKEKLLAPNPGNAKGYFERRDVMKINNHILQARGETWKLSRTAASANLSKAWAPKPDLQFDEQMAVLKSLSPPWVIKDPRMCVTARDWARALQEENPIALLLIRNPAEISASLSRRDDMSLMDTLRLIDLSWGGALATIQEFGWPYAIVQHSSIMSNPIETMKRVQAFLRDHGLKVNKVDPAQVDKFVEESLRHNNDQSLSGQRVFQTYDLLQQHALHP